MYGQGSSRWIWSLTAAGVAPASFLDTLSMVDVATGCVARGGLRDKRSETVFHALQRLRAELPFRVLGLDSDKATEVHQARVARVLR